MQRKWLAKKNNNGWPFILNSWSPPFFREKNARTRSLAPLLDTYLRDEPYFSYSNQFDLFGRRSYLENCRGRFSRGGVFMRPLWKGALSFGMVNIPIRLYSATAERQVDFDLLHKKDLSPIRYARICKEDGQEIPFKDIVKGYEYEPGDYIIMTDEDFDKIDPKKSKTIEISDFTLESEIDAIYFDKPYYLEPEKGAAKAYILLREALKKSGKVAIASFVIRQREHIGVIKPHKDLLILDQMRYHSTLKATSEFEIPKEKPSPKELDLALKLIDQLTVEFQPEKYADTYTDELLAMIEAKKKGIKRKPKAVKEAKATKVVDLMGLLKASLGKKKKSA